MHRANSPDVSAAVVVPERAAGAEWYRFLPPPQAARMSRAALAAITRMSMVISPLLGRPGGCRAVTIAMREAQGPRLFTLAQGATPSPRQAVLFSGRPDGRDAWQWWNRV